MVSAPLTRSRRLTRALTAALLIAPGALTASPDNNRGNPHTFEPALVTPIFENASVHDPSVIRTDDQFYVFGSHLAAARSADLMQWQQVADGANAANPLFEDVQAELAETFEWAETDTLWATDVIQLADGRYYMYYNACRGDAPRSAMGIAVADHIEGPYENQGIFLKSGMWGEPSEDGRIYDARIHPNAVDPNVFFDAEGRLWMIYGSYSGGLFILEMDPETGFPKPEQGYGKHLMGGNHSRIEAPYVLYSPETEYYYLFASFGGLSADGGYNVRIARSRQPDGPYYDIEGNDMATVQADPSQPIFDDDSIEPYGNLVLGNHLFDRELGEQGEGIGTGYVSPGHNSAYYDEATGRQYIIFHSRFPQRGEIHEVRAHELLMNANDWPLVAPHRYAERRAAEGSEPSGQIEQLRRAEVIGDYKFLILDKTISAEVVDSDYLELTNNGRITGDGSGRWWFDGNNQVTLELDGTRYTGVLSRQWQETAGRFTVTFTAQSGQGISLWGSQLPERGTDELLTAILDDIDVARTAVVDNLALPTEGTRNSVIEWQSSAPGIVANDGTVTRPSYDQGDQTLSLTAKVSLRGETRSRVFPVTVRAEAPNGLVAHYGFDGTLADNSGQQNAGGLSGRFIDTPGGTARYVGGITGQAFAFDGNTGVRLPNGLIAGHEYSVSFWLNPSEINAFTTTFFGARSPDRWLSFLPEGHGFVNGETMLWSGTAWYDAGTGLNIPRDAWSHVAFTVDNGAVRVYIDGQQRFAGNNFPDLFTGANGVFSLAVNWWDVPYQGLMDELRLYERVLSASEVADLASE